jgi:DNA-directed RNA polymerase specialized sigma24 family protein
MLTDEYLMKLVKHEGNHDAIAELFRRHHDATVLPFLIRLGLANDAAEETASDVFIATWLYRDWYQDNASVRNWFLKIAANRWKNYRTATVA